MARPGIVRDRIDHGLKLDQRRLVAPFEATPRELIIRYAGRNRIEGGLGISVNLFHLDCLASEVRLMDRRKVSCPAPPRAARNYRSIASVTSSFPSRVATSSRSCMARSTRACSRRSFI